MSADFKSHILRRDEKGLLGVPFKRWLLAGVSGGLTYTVFGIGLPGLSWPAGLVVTVLGLLLTQVRGGLPLWQRALYSLRGSLLLRAAAHPAGLAAQVVDALDLPQGVVHLDSAQVFAPPTRQTAVDLREWITFAYADEPDGLIFVDAPLGGPR